MSENRAMTMSRLLRIGVLVSATMRAQSVESAAELFRKVQAFADFARTWKAEVIETSQLSGPGINLHEEVRTKLAAQTPLKMRRQNSGSDQTVLVCDGVETFYSGDGNGYYKGDARVTPQCDLPLSKFYEFEDNPTSISVVGQDHVRLADSDRLCVVVRATWRQEQVITVRTMFIDVSRPVVLRDVMERGDERTGMKLVKTTTFTSFETNPVFPPDTFRFSVPPSAVEVKPPI